MTIQFPSGINKVSLILIKSISEQLKLAHGTGGKDTAMAVFFSKNTEKSWHPQQVLLNYSFCTKQRVLIYYIYVWYFSWTVANQKTLQWVVSRVQKITRLQLWTLQDVYSSHCLRKVSNCKDTTHPCHNLFELLPSSKFYRAFHALTKSLAQG